MFTLLSDDLGYYFLFLRADPFIGTENKVKIMYTAARMLIAGEERMDLSWDEYEGRLTDMGPGASIGGYAGHRFKAEHIVGGSTRSLEFIVHEPRRADIVPDAMPGARSMRA